MHFGIWTKKDSPLKTELPFLERKTFIGQSFFFAYTSYSDTHICRRGHLKHDRSDHFFCKYPVLNGHLHNHTLTFTIHPSSGTQGGVGEGAGAGKEGEGLNLGPEDAIHTSLSGSKWRFWELS
jgi:hypothetical protein